MYALFIDTSNETKIFAILKQDAIVANTYCYSAISTTIDESLFSWLQESIEKHKFTLADITCIAIGYGPGPSFTGIRTGAVLGSTLAYAYSIPVIGLCSLELYKPANDVNNFYVISNARGGELYYVESKNNYQFTTPKLANIQDWHNRIKKNGNRVISVEHKFFEEIIDGEISPATIHWEYIMKKIFTKKEYLDPLFFTIPYFKNPK